MTDEQQEQQEKEAQEGRSRPKVVDRRISARRAAGEVIESTPPRSDVAGAGTSGVAGEASAEGQRIADAQAFEDQRGGDPGGGGSGGGPVDDAPAVEDQQRGDPGDVGTGGTREPDVWTPEQEAEARRMMEELARTPSIEWVVQAAVSLANVAGTKLEAGAVADAQLAIDALAGIINAVGPRLQGAEQPLRQTLAQLQLAYTQSVGGIAPPAV